MNLALLSFLIIENICSYTLLPDTDCIHTIFSENRENFFFNFDYRFLNDRQNLKIATKKPSVENSNFSFGAKSGVKSENPQRAGNCTRGSGLVIGPMVLDE